MKTQKARPTFQMNISAENLFYLRENTSNNGYNMKGKGAPIPKQNPRKIM